MIALVTRQSQQRRLIAAAVTLGAAAALAGCSAGQHTQTSTQAAAVNGAAASWTKDGGTTNVPTLQLRDVRFALPTLIEKGSTTNLTGGSADLAFTIINNDPTTKYTLTTVAAKDSTGKVIGEATLAGAELAPGHGIVAPAKVKVAPNLTAVDATLTNLAADICPGPRIPVTFTFESASGNAEITVKTPVDAGPVNHNDRYADGEARRADAAAVESENCLGS